MNKQTKVEELEVVEEAAMAPVHISTELAPDDLSRYVQTANDMQKNVDRAVGQIQSLQHYVITNALGLGYLLSYIRENAKHGQWLKLFKTPANPNRTHVSGFEFNERTARRFIALYKNMEGRALAYGGEERSGQLMLQLQNSVSSPGALVAVDDLTDSKTLTQIYTEFGILSKRKPAAAEKVPAAMQQAQKENLKRTEDDAMRAAAQIVTLANEYANFDASMCAKTFNAEIAAQLREIAGRIAKAGKPSA